ncbi:hypothetical protein [Rhizobium sp. CSW-27]|uniref:hypothetical protein n=1 Tax=Rhizobium sp. CSW-27 TaxID=2839985 RepID=UPI001C033A31|nr:hypothetical protein [Rhizobium sp. CSW-27]MBT9370274.1 hypothetical protein [Rhizobium sp. CSW-27]
MATSHEQAVRDAATALHEAIAEACAAGLHITWPRSVHGLPTLAISQSAVLAPEPQAPAEVAGEVKTKAGKA